MIEKPDDCSTKRFFPVLRQACDPACLLYTSIKIYAKLPAWFKVPTPLGTYNPDWAVLVEKDGTERLYFVVETKSSLFSDDLRDRESAKIKCGEAHFDALATGDNPARFVKATKLDDVMAKC